MASKFGKGFKGIGKTIPRNQEPTTGIDKHGFQAIRPRRGWFPFKKGTRVGLIDSAKSGYGKIVGYPEHGYANVKMPRTKKPILVHISRIFRK